MNNTAKKIIEKHMATGIAPDCAFIGNNMGAPCGGGKCNNQCSRLCSTPGGKCGGKCQSKCRK